MIGDGLYLALVLGLPVAALSWLLFSRLFARGVVGRDSDRETLEDERAIRKRASDDAVAGRLTRYGGGFYGLTGLWTLLVTEVRDLWGLIAAPPDFAALLGAGPGAVLSAFIRAQVENFVTAMTWFAYWGETHVLLTLVVAFLGFRVGLEAARRTRTEALPPRLRRLLGAGGG